MSYLERLFTTRSRRRYFVIALSALALAGLFCGDFLQGDNQQQFRYLQLRNAQLQQTIGALNQKVSALPVKETRVVATIPPVFSMIETLRKSGGRLIRWQPGEPLARLELFLAWNKVPCFFQYISNYQDVNLTSFQIHGVSDPTIVALTVEFSHENH